VLIQQLSAPAARHQRITIAVPSCSFAPTVNPSGYIFHCDCNMVPGLMELGGLATVASQRPKNLLHVVVHNGTQFTGLDNMKIATTDFHIVRSSTKPGPARTRLRLPGGLAPASYFGQAHCDALQRAKSAAAAST
jgi:hypothetical protein